MGEDLVEVLLVFPCWFGPPAVKGTTIKCSRCKVECWLAPTSKTLLDRKPTITVLCSPCGQDTVADLEIGGANVEHAPVPEAKYPRGGYARETEDLKTSIADLINLKKRGN